MKVLMSAYACEPGKGSEPAVGWHWARQAARFHEVWVITRTNNRCIIEAELDGHPVPNLHFVYHDLPAWARKWKKGGRGIHLYYLLWQISAVPVAHRLHREHRFDVAHHVTFVTARYPSFLCALDIPFVWGPIGGGERVPWSFLKRFGAKWAVLEVARSLSTSIAKMDPFVRRTGSRASRILLATPETKSVLPRRSQTGVQLVPAIGIESIAYGAGALCEESRSSMLRLLFVGNLLPLKGLELGVLALARALRLGADVNLTVVGDGPLESALRKQAQSLGISKFIDFKGRVPYEETCQLYRNFDILLFPSLRDSGGFVVLEAMASGLPVICLDLGGPAISVLKETGIRIPAHDPEQAVHDMTIALIRLAKEPELRRSMGAAGQHRVREQYDWDRKGEFLHELYSTMCHASELDSAS